MRTTSFSITVVAVGLMAVAVAGAQQKPGTKGAAAPPKPGVYSDTQAQRGEALYADNCAYCHLVDLTGGELAPPLTGAAFVGRWTTRPLSDVFEYIRVEMPLNSPGGLSPQQDADVLAFMLRKAGFAAGQNDLPAKAEQLKGITVK